MALVANAQGEIIDYQKDFTKDAWQMWHGDGCRQLQQS